MQKEVIISTEHTLGGSPRLNGRRLDVHHVIWGIIEYDKESIQSYQDDFEVTNEQIRHAIMYCKDEVCELQNVPQSCNGCSKLFYKDLKSLEESKESHQKNSETTNSWKIAKGLHLKLKSIFNLPESYEELINNL